MSNSTKTESSFQEGTLEIPGIGDQKDINNKYFVYKCKRCNGDVRARLTDRIECPNPNCKCTTAIKVRPEPKSETDEEWVYSPARY